MFGREIEMKLTPSRLRKIIVEEVNKVISERADSLDRVERFAANQGVPVDDVLALWDWSREYFETGAQLPVGTPEGDLYDALNQSGIADMSDVGAALQASGREAPMTSPRTTESRSLVKLFLSGRD